MGSTALIIPPFKITGPQTLPKSGYAKYEILYEIIKDYIKQAENL
jgi:hypothetical protein